METPAQKQVVVFGGAFNPPTLAHEQIMADCLALPVVDEVWVMPSGDRADKAMASADKDRLAMLRAVKTERFDDNPRLVISDIELDLPRPSETIVTLGALATRYPDNHFWFVFGADSYQDMPRWHRGAELRERMSVLLLRRGGIFLPPESAQVRYLPTSAPESSVSSTEVRRASEAGESLSSLVSEPVQRYIAARALYGYDVRKPLVASATQAYLSAI